MYICVDNKINNANKNDNEVIEFSKLNIDSEDYITIENCYIIKTPMDFQKIFLNDTNYYQHRNNLYKSQNGFILSKGLDIMNKLSDLIIKYACRFKSGNIVLPSYGYEMLLAIPKNYINTIYLNYNTDKQILSIKDLLKMNKYYVHPQELINKLQELKGGKYNSIDFINFIKKEGVIISKIKYLTLKNIGDIEEIIIFVLYFINFRNQNTILRFVDKDNVTAPNIEETVNWIKGMI
jgi:hypothetical protein